MAAEQPPRAGELVDIALRHLGPHQAAIVDHRGRVVELIPHRRDVAADLAVGEVIAFRRRT